MDYMGECKDLPQRPVEGLSACWCTKFAAYEPINKEEIEQGLSNNDSDSGEDFDLSVPIDDDGNIDWSTDDD
ncbi:hypothetical protein BYT27DRAFT_7264262 [Phlegmacium glaucopus]|nr:hypothetical protein BYT27DRAFT_7264262 [Phlegmacium glaucopus]